MIKWFCKNIGCYSWFSAQVVPPAELRSSGWKYLTLSGGIYMKGAYSQRDLVQIW